MTLLLAIIPSIMALSPTCPPDCTSADAPDLISTDPDLAYTLDPIYTIETLGDEFLGTRPQIAYDYFKDNPNKMIVYRKGATNYFLSSKKPDRTLMKKYLQIISVTMYGKDFDVARKYLSSSSFSSIDDRNIIANLILTNSQLTSKDKALAKKYLTKNGGKYINQDSKGKIVFAKYLKSEGVDVRVIKGNVVSFTSDGKLKCKGSSINVYELKKGGAKDKYAMKVASDGKLILILKKKEIKTVKKTEKEVKEEREKVKTLGRTARGFLNMFGMGDTLISDEDIDEFAEKRVSDERIVEVEKTDDIPLEGDVRVNGETGTISLKKGKIREINVRNAEDVTFTGKTFTGRIGEVEGVEFEQEKIINFDSGKEEKKFPVITVHDKYAFIYTAPGDEDKPAREKKVSRITPVIEGYGAKIKRIKNTKIGSYDKIAIDPKTNEEYTRTYQADLDIPGGESSIQLAGEFVVDDYDNIDKRRNIYLSSTSDSLALNEVTIPALEGHRLRVFMPNQEKEMTSPKYLSQDFIGFTDDGIVTHGNGVSTTLTPSALVQHEYALTGTSNDVMELPSRGFYRTGDRGKKGSRTYDAITQIQRVVGAKETGVYDKKTANKVKEWQSKQVNQRDALNLKGIADDGFFGTESLRTLLDTNEGSITSLTSSSDSETTVRFKKGKLITDVFGDSTVRKGKEVFKHSPPKIVGMNRDKGEVMLDEINTALSERVQEETSVFKGKVEKLVGEDPYNLDVSYPMDIRAGISVFPEDRITADEFYVFNNYFNFDARKKARDDSEFNAVAALGNDIDFIDAFVNPDLIEQQGGVVKIHPDFKDMVDDGKLRVLYVPGASKEYKSSGKISNLNFDTNGVLPDDRITKRSLPRKYMTDDGQEIEVEIVVAYTAKEAEEQYALGGFDVFHLSSHTWGGKYPGFSLGKKDLDKVNRGVFRPWAVPETKTMKRDQKPKLISISGCMARERVGKELDRSTHRILTQSKVGKDAGTVVLTGLLTGRSPAEIAYISAVEEGASRSSYKYLKPGEI
jgi:hypothetical protein